MDGAPGEKYPRRLAWGEGRFCLSTTLPFTLAGVTARSRDGRKSTPKQCSWWGVQTDCDKRGAIKHTPLSLLSSSVQEPPTAAPLGGVVGAIPKANNCICLRAFLALNDVELDLIAFFQRFVPIQLYCRVVDEYIRPVFTSDESVALGVVEPFHFPFVLSHRFLPSSFCYGDAGARAWGISTVTFNDANCR